MVKVKICGLTREEDVEAAIDAGADSLGFVVGVPSSLRNITLSRAKELSSKIPENVNSVAVTVFKDLDELKRIYRELDTDFVQLHGSLYPFLESIVMLSFGRRIIRVVNAKAANALDLAGEYSRIFNAVLLDTAGVGGVGGTGVTHDWELSSRIRDAIQPFPLILAGGLTCENVGEAVRKVRPYGVDVSSGVEKSPGVKDHEKMFEFIRRVNEVVL